MGNKRTYGEGCAAAHALDLVGERWALLVVRELLLGPKRFTDLRIGIPHASPNVLSQRLRELEEAGVVRRGELPPPFAAKIYELTEWGKGLEPVIVALGDWGSRSPQLPRGEQMSVDSYMLALKTIFDADAAGGLSATYQLRIDGHRFRVRVEHGELELERGTIDEPDATIITDSETFASLIWEGRKPAEAVKSCDLAIEGDKAAAARFIGLFPLPAPVDREVPALA
jgi:DNA-binding HxlR family transcriptional regulator